MIRRWGPSAEEKFLAGWEVGPPSGDLDRWLENDQVAESPLLVNKWVG